MSTKNANEGEKSSFVICKKEVDTSDNNGEGKSKETYDECGKTDFEDPLREVFEGVVLHNNLEKAFGKSNCEKICVTIYAEDVAETSTTDGSKSSKNDVKPHLCATCGREFKYFSTLKTHEFTHLEKKTFKCPVCLEDRFFRSPSNLRTHMKIHGRKPHKCSWCDKIFHSTNDLRKHVRTHTLEKPYACQFCEKKFAEQGTLTRHYRTHTGEKPYTCKTCGKCFALACTLKTHMRWHNGVRQFVCKTCGASYVTSGGLSQHIAAKHTDAKPYACETCGKDFSFRGTLNQHRKIHTGKTHVCETCGLKFACSAYLKKHTEKQHLNPNIGKAKPFTCKTCGNKFTSKGNLTRHSKYHHDVKPSKENLSTSQSGVETD